MYRLESCFEGRPIERPIIANSECGAVEQLALRIDHQARNGTRRCRIATKHATAMMQNPIVGRTSLRKVNPTLVLNASFDRVTI